MDETLIEAVLGFFDLNIERWNNMTEDEQKALVEAFELE